MLLEFEVQDDIIGPSRYLPNYDCDICKHFVGVGSTLFGCRAEDFDICKVREKLGQLQPL